MRNFQDGMNEEFLFGQSVEDKLSFLYPFRKASTHGSLGMIILKWSSPMVSLAYPEAPVTDQLSKYSSVVMMSGEGNLTLQKGNFGNTKVVAGKTGFVPGKS